MRNLRGAAFALLVLSLASQPLFPQSSAPAVVAAPARPPLPPRHPEDAITPVPKDTNRHEEFLDRIQEASRLPDARIDLVFLGDSIMDNWPRRGESSWLRYAPYHPADFGVSGDCTEHVLWRIEHGELDGFSPKVIVLMIGTNNINRLDQPEWAVAGVQKVVEAIRAKQPKAKLLLLGIFARGKKAGRDRADAITINTAIRKLDNGSSIRYLDIGSVFLDADGEIPRDVMPDRLHPTAKGYYLWYDAMQPLLAEMMK